MQSLVAEYNNISLLHFINTIYLINEAMENIFLSVLSSIHRTKTSRY